jgi:2-oxo-4-hydroxy-4-carboxy--5-ureidoimidazoline (OHCU) decarboxylase
MATKAGWTKPSKDQLKKMLTPIQFDVTQQEQTHNVLATLPGDMEYSPLWLVTAYDGMDFDKVMNISSAMGAMAVAKDIATVNCPVFFDLAGHIATAEIKGAMSFRGAAKAPPSA